MGWFRSDVNAVNGALVASSSSQRFLDLVKQEIALYKELIFGAETTSETSLDVGEPQEEHDLLVYRVQKTSKTQLEDAEYLEDLINKPDRSVKINNDLTVGDISCLASLEWLNDEVINCYMSMINDACKKLGLPVYCWNTFFWTNLNSDQEYTYDKVRRWTTRKKIDVFSLSLMIVPLHINSVHWSLGVVDMKSKLIFYFDSLEARPSSNYVKTLRQYLQDEWNDKKTGDTSFDANEFIFAGNNFGLSCLSTAGPFDQGTSSIGDVREAHIPTQANGSDCGVFTCLFARELAFNRYPFNFHSDVSLIRLQMVSNHGYH